MNNDPSETDSRKTPKPAFARWYWKLWGGVGLVIFAIVFSMGWMEWRYQRLIQHLRSNGIVARPTPLTPSSTLAKLDTWFSEQTGLSLPVPPRYDVFVFHPGTFTEERLDSLSGLFGPIHVAWEQADISVETLRKFIRDTPNLSGLSFVDCQFITHEVTDQLAIDYPSLTITNMGATS